MAGESSEQKVLRLKKDFRPSTVNPFSKMVELIGGVTFVNPPNDPFRERRGAKVRIALASMPFFDYDVTTMSSLCMPSNAPDGVDPTAFLRQIAAFRGPTSARMLSVFRDTLETAISAFEPDIICFNELGLPSDDMVSMLEAKRLAWEKSQQYEVLIIAGSGHDSRSLYNTGYLFRPGGPMAGECFHKTISAQLVGELISAPAARTITAVEFAGLQIAVMICLDVADYASIASVVKVGDGVDVLLVPCYTPKFEAMGSIADVTSKALPGVVAMVNAELPDADARCYRISSFGSRQKPVTKKELDCGAVISIVDINHAEFQEKRTRLQIPGEASDVEFLFGRRGMPVVHSAQRQA